MSALPRAMLVREEVARLTRELSGVEAVGIDVRSGSDFGVRVNLAADAPSSTFDSIPDRIDDVDVRKTVRPRLTLE